MADDLWAFVASKWSSKVDEAEAAREKAIVARIGERICGEIPDVFFEDAYDIEDDDDWRWEIQEGMIDVDGRGCRPWAELNPTS